MKHVSLSVTLNSPKDELLEQLKRVCVALVSQEFDSQDFNISVVNGGITNALFRCQVANRNAVVRVFGDKTELIIDRIRELKASEILARSGFGKKVFGEFDGGRVEEWLEGRTLKPNEMIELAEKIGGKLALMHKLNVEDELIPKDLGVWRMLDNWLENAKLVSFQGDQRKEEILASLNVKQLEVELKNLKEILKGSKSPMVFCHNDLLSGNVFLNNESEINFIDFEYGAYNPRAFDIANHFCECCGFDCDWNQFPQRAQQEVFFKSYLKNSLGKEPSSDEVEQLYQEVRPWTLASHLFWGIWAIVQAKHSPIDFDFLAYSKLRIDGYYQHKAYALGN